MYLMPPGVGSMPSAALSLSESGAGFTGSPFRNLGKERQEGVLCAHWQKHADRKGMTDNGHRVSFGVIKNSGTERSANGCTTTNILNAAELYTSKCVLPHIKTGQE